MIAVTPNEIATPMAPPSTQIDDDSNRNCVRIARRQVCFRISAEEYARTSAYCARTGLTRREVFIELLDAFLEDRPPDLPEPGERGADARAEPPRTGLEKEPEPPPSPPRPADGGGILQF